ncbi:MAG: hypothetical protein M3N22_03645 [Acidobacteriota bacterium]|nr:hypothetical protein [Acidobacteriota bacterium]
MLRSAIFGMLISGAVSACTLTAQTQSDPQAGAQLGEQSALAAKQAQGANTEKAAASANAAGPSLVAGTTLNAELTGSVDSKKAKPGTVINARTLDAYKSSDSRIILPKGTKIVGHVTGASARGSGQADSFLGIAFDKAVVKGGQEIPLNVAIQALAAPPASSNMNQNPNVEPTGGSPSGTSRNTMGGVAGGVGAGAGRVGSTAGRVASGASGTVDDTAGAAAGTVDSTTRAVTNTTAGLNGAGQLNSNSRGVIGIDNLTLSSTTTGNAQGSVITSTGKNVHLDSGTRLLLVAQSATAAPADRGEGASERKPEQKP